MNRTVLGLLFWITMIFLLMDRTVKGQPYWVIAEKKVDARFDCKVVLKDIFSEDSTVKSNLLKVNQEKTHSVLSQRSSERVFLQYLKKRSIYTHRLHTCS